MTELEQGYWSWRTMIMLIYARLYKPYQALRPQLHISTWNQRRNTFQFFSPLFTFGGGSKRRVNKVMNSYRYCDVWGCHDHAGTRLVGISLCFGWVLLRDTAAAPRLLYLLHMYVANFNNLMDQITRKACAASERKSCACFAWAFSSNDQRGTARIAN